VAQGRFVEAGDVDKRADVAILGYQAARLNPIEALRYK